MKALILAGGESFRMKTDKSKIIYREKEIRYELYEILKPLVEDIYISCNLEQSSTINQSYKYIIDNPNFSNCGPMTGLISAFDTYKDCSWLVIACDYPLLSLENITYLISQRKKDLYATIYFNNNTHFLEPLIGIYERNIIPYIFKSFQENQYSIRRVLEQLPIHKIICNDVFLQSIDTPELMNQIKNKIQ
jgi:molybdopterin-guanine dinucleotide biosynthesis protein A